MAGTLDPSHIYNETYNYVRRFMTENMAGRVLVSGNKLGKKPKINIAQLKAHDAEPVRGRFHYLETPGGTMHFVYKYYKGDPVVRYDLTDGEVYTLPKGVARHLNKNVGHYEHQRLLGLDGTPSVKAKRRIRKCSFEHLEFMDIEDIKDIEASSIEKVTIDDLPPLTR